MEEDVNAVRAAEERSSIFVSYSDKIQSTGEDCFNSRRAKGAHHGQPSAAACSYGLTKINFGESYHVEIVNSFLEAKRRHILLKVFVAIHGDAANEGRLDLSPVVNWNRVLRPMVQDNRGSNLLLVNVTKGGDTLLVRLGERLVELLAITPCP